MTYRVIYLERARQDMREIVTYLAQFYASTARNFVDRLKKQVELLKTMPYMNPVYEDVPFFRRMIVGDYLLFYSVDEVREAVVIHRIFHHSRDIREHMLD